MMSLLRNSQSIKVGQVIRSVQLAPNTQVMPTPPVVTQHQLSKLSTESVPPGPPATPPAPQKNPDEEYERGLAKGREEARRELAASMAAVAKMAEALKREAIEIRKASDRHATELALCIARKVIGKELSDPVTVASMIMSALNHVPGMSGLGIHLNPKDMETLSAHRNLFPEDAKLISDDTISRGGCIIVSSLGELDARVETQLALVQKALLADERKA